MIVMSFGREGALLTCVQYVSNTALVEKAKSHILRMDNQLKQAMSLLHESERLREEGEKKLAMFESDKSVDDILGSDLRPKENV